MLGAVEPASSLRFAQAARRLGAATQAAGLAVPAFRSPPRQAGSARTIRRFPGGAVISVRIKERPFDAVLSDMVEGVLVANGVAGEAALRLGQTLRSAVTGEVDAPAQAA
jgi:hypothetical protein